jgi:hypothetical protein
MDAKLQNLIPALKPILDKIDQTDFRLTAALKAQALLLMGE